MKRTKNTLSNRQSHQLALWAEARFEEIRGLGRGEIAKRARAACGFPVTVGNILGLEDVLGAEFTQPAVPRASDLIAVLAKDSIDLRHSLGQPVSDELKALAGVMV